MVFDFLKRGPEPVAVEKKASATGRVVAFGSSGRVAWSPRDAVSLARSGFQGNPIGFRAVKLISEAAAALPLVLQDAERRYETHPVLDLIRRPNGAQGRAELFEAVYGYLLLSGNAYLEAVPGAGALPGELHVLRSDRMALVPGADGWPVAYDYTVGGRTHRFAMSVDAQPICHIKTFHPQDDHYGFSPLQAAATALDVHTSASAWSKALLDNAARPSGAIVYKGVDGQGQLSSDQYDRLLSEMESHHQGARNAGRPMLLEGGLDWKPMGFSPSDMEFQKTKEAAAREIAIAFGVPPMLMGIPGDATYANYQEANRAFYRLTVLPLVQRVAASVSHWLPDATGEVVAQTDLPLALTNGEAAAMAERWLVESRLARDTLRFSLPPSMRDIGAGSVVELDSKRYRIDRCELTASQALEAVRIDPAVYRDPRIDPEATTWKPYQPPTPPYPLFLDLPSLTGSEKPHVPHVAIAASPWPGQMAIWSSATEAGFAVNTLIERSALIGVTETDLPRGASSRWERGPALRLRMGSGNLTSAEELSVLAGSNAIAIGDGSPDNWEIIQFRDAVLVAPATFEIATRLRGQLGTDGVMPDLWPAGSLVVVLDSALKQIVLPQSARGLVRNYRIGDATRGYDSPGVIAKSEAFDGIGLRPYSVCHLRKTGSAGVDVGLSWIRRTRIDGDSWQSVEVPLGEETESYRVQIKNGAALLREVNTTSPSWTYSAAMQGACGAGPATRIEVAQVSVSFGAGPAVGLTLG